MDNLLQDYFFYFIFRNLSEESYFLKKEITPEKIQKLVSLREENPEVFFAFEGDKEIKKSRLSDFKIAFQDTCGLDYWGTPCEVSFEKNEIAKYLNLEEIFCGQCEEKIEDSKLWRRKLSNDYCLDCLQDMKGF